MTRAGWAAGELVVSIVNYEGPPKVFWEFRSLSGPFFRGNVSNGFALWVAPQADFPSLSEFAEALDALPLSDGMSGSARRIGWGEGVEQLVWEYDPRDLRS